MAASVSSRRGPTLTFAGDGARAKVSYPVAR